MDYQSCCDERAHPGDQHDFEHIEERFIFYISLLVKF